MSFNLKEPSTFINIKLTDAGRRQLSLGKLKFTSAVFSDREVNYGIDRTGYYNISSNRIISPKDYHPSLSLNFDNTNAFTLGETQVLSAKQFTTADTPMVGFFSGSTNNWTIDYANFAKGVNNIRYSVALPSGSTAVTLSNTMGSYLPADGDLAYIPWQTPQNSGHTAVIGLVPSGNPTNNLWYRVVSRTGNVITLDRNTPNFKEHALATGSGDIPIYFYPYNGVEEYYGSGATSDARVWNMNIVRTGSYPGTPLSITGDTHYRAFGSIEFSGTKHYFGFDEIFPAVGIIHYTNEYTGNTYAEQFIEKTFVMNIPNVMWHKISATNGQAMEYGITLSDVDGDTIFDSASQTTYRNLKDGIASTSNIVGRVYHKLKMIVITDQELLAALSYKSNRSFTLPTLDLTLVKSPKFPLNTSQASGFTRSNYEYFVTYAVESFSATSVGKSFGHGPILPCMNFSRITGQNDTNGNAQYLSASFPSQSFPYMRSSANMPATTAYSGTGWNANKIQLLVSEQLVTDGIQDETVPVRSWTAVSTSIGNGIYTGDTSDTTIDPLKLAGYQFIISSQDIASGTTYDLNPVIYQGYQSLNFGNEAFFFGTIDVDILSTTYKTVITAFAKNDELNSTANSTFDELEDENVYITEIAILDDASNVVAVGKPTYPIKKAEGRFLAFQLEIDF